MKRWAVSLLVCGLLLAAAPPARAEGWLEKLNHVVFDFNAAVSARVERYLSGDTAPSVPDWLKEAASNMLVNLVNEPLTAGAFAIAGDGPRSWHAVKRFAINSTFGYLGAVDRAREWNLPRDQTDLGLALCSWKVPDGPYIVLPFAGPRTLRDAFADVIVANVMIYGALTPFIGFPPSAQSFIVVETLDVAATLAIARQIDGPPKAWHEDSYESVRDAYLYRRRISCAAAGG